MPVLAARRVLTAKKVKCLMGIAACSIFCNSINNKDGLSNKTLIDACCIICNLT